MTLREYFRKPRGSVSWQPPMPTQVNQAIYSKLAFLGQGGRCHLLLYHGEPPHP